MSEEMEALADEAATHWPMVRFYPTLGGGWVGMLNGAQSVHGATLTEVVAQAAKLRPIPEVPRCPERRTLRVEKSTGAYPWQIMWGTQCIYAQKTKREAEAAVETILARRDAEIAAWHEKWDGLICTGVEGVDFKWKAGT